MAHCGVVVVGCGSSLDNFTVVGSGSSLFNLTWLQAEILRTIIYPELKCLDLEELWNSNLQDCTPKSNGGIKRTKGATR